MTTPSGNMVISDKMLYSSNGGGVNSGCSGTDERDKFILRLRGEFAAANAIIDSLCHHLKSGGENGEYDDVIGSIQQRRCKWNPVLHMQRYFSVAEVQYALQQATWQRQQLNRDGYNFTMANGTSNLLKNDALKSVEKDFTVASKYNNGFNSKLTLSASFKSEVKEVVYKYNPNLKVTAKTFVATEMLDGKLINVVEGLKLYEELFDESEVLKMDSLVNYLIVAGRQGKFHVLTYVVSKRPMKGHGKEMIQLGLPIAYAPYVDDVISERKIHPIPSLFQDVIDRLMALQAITVKPDSCIIDVFNEGVYSQPHTLPPWFGRPVCVLFLTECEMVFGRLTGPHFPGEYKGSINLSLTPGSMLIMEGRSADTKHAIPSTRRHRILVTFTKSEPKTAPTSNLQCSPPHWIPPPTIPLNPIFVPAAAVSPAMAFPASPVVLPPPRLPVAGTGVFLLPGGNCPAQTSEKANAEEDCNVNPAGTGVFLPPVGNCPAQLLKKASAEEDCNVSPHDNGGDDMAAVVKGEQDEKRNNDAI